MTAWTNGVCRANGVDLHYLRSGGAKPPLLALHGLTGSGACWTPLALALAAEWEIVAPDARGHGRSSAPPRGYSYDDHAADVVGLIESLALASPVLLGHSMGGMTAALAASRLGAALGGLVLADPTFLSPERQREVYAGNAIAQHRRWLALTRDEALAEARRRHPRRSPEIVELVVDARRSTPVQPFDVLAPPNPDFRELIAAIRAPILLIIAEHGVVSLATAQELQSLNPRLQVVFVADAGHALPYDQPERFAATVRDFLSAF